MSTLSIAATGKKTSLPKELRNALADCKRVGMHGNASSLIESFLFAVDEDFRERSIDIQEEIVLNKRKELAKMVRADVASYEDEEDTEIEGFAEFMRVFDDESRSVKDFIKELKKTDTECPIETLGLLEKVHGVRALVFHQKDGFKLDCNVSIGKKEKCILLLHHTKGYEPIIYVGEDQEDIKGVFKGKDDVIKSLLASELCKGAEDGGEEEKEASNDTDESDEEDAESASSNDEKATSESASSNDEKATSESAASTDEKAVSEEDAGSDASNADKSEEAYSDDESIEEDYLDEADIEFINDENLDEIVRVVQKQLDHIVYTPDQLMNALHELLTTKAKRPFFKRAIQTYMDMYSSVQAQPNVKGVLVDSLGQQIRAGDLNVAGLLPIVQVPTDDRNDTDYLTGRYNIVHSATDSAIQKTARLFQHQAPFASANDADIPSFVAKRDVEALVDVPAGRKQRFIGSIPFHLLTKQHTYMYEGDALIVQGFAHGLNGKTTPPQGLVTINVSDYMRHVKQLRKGDDVVVYPNTYLYDEDDQVLETIRATVSESSNRFLKLKLETSVKPSPTEFLRNVLVYDVSAANPFFIYHPEEEAVYHKSLLSGGCFAFERDDALPLEQLLAFILPTPQEFAYVFRRHLEQVQSITGLQSMLSLCGLDATSMPQTTFADIKATLDKNVSAQPSTFGKAAPKLEYMMPKKSAISKPSWLRNVDVLQLTYPDLVIPEARRSEAFEIDMMFALQRKNDQGHLLLLRHYQDYLQSKLSKSAKESLHGKLETVKRLIKDQEKEMDDLDDEHLVTKQQLQPVEYESKEALLATNGTYHKDLHQRYATVGNDVYKRIRLRWVPIGSLNAEGRYNMLSLYSTYLPYLQDTHDLKALMNIRSYLTTQKELARLQATEKALMQWLDSSAAALDNELDAMHSFKVPETKAPEISYAKTHIGGSVAKGTRLEDEMVFIVDKYDAFAAKNMPLIQDVVEEVQEDDKDPKSKSKLIRRLAAAASITLQDEHVQMILDNLPEFEEVLLKTKLQALMKAEKNQGKPIDKKELLKRLAKDDTALQNTAIIILAFLSILVFSPSVTFEPVAYGDCELKEKTPQGVREYISCCAVLDTKHEPTPLFPQPDKVNTRVEQTALYILEKRAALKIMLDAAKDALMKESVMATKGEDWGQFRPPLHISRAQRVSSAPVAQFIHRVVQATARQRPLRINMAKQAVFDNACCLESLSQEYTYWASSKVTAPDVPLHLEGTRIPSVIVPKEMAPKDELPRPHIKQKKTVRVDAHGDDVNVADMSMQLRRLVEANKLLSHDAILAKLIENPEDEDAWRSLSTAKDGYWNLITEALDKTINAKELANTYMLFDYPHTKIPVVLKGFAHFLRNSFRRYTAQVFNLYHPKQRAGVNLPAYHQKHAAAITASYQQYDPQLEKLLDATSQHTFFKDSVEAVEKVMGGMGQNLHALHFITSQEEEVDATYKSLYVLSYVFLKTLAYMLWSLGDSSDISLRKLVKKEDDLPYLSDGIDAAMSNRGVSTLIKEWVRLLLTKGVAVVEEHLVNEEVYKTQIKTLRELKKTEAIKRYENLPDELRGIVKRLEEIGAVSIRDTRFNVNQDDPALDKDAREIEGDIDAAAEGEEYTFQLHEKGENEDDIDDDDYDDDAF